MSLPQASNPEGVAAPLDLYSHVTTVASGSELCFLSGQVGKGPDGVVPDGFADQSDEAFANIVRLLAGLDMTPANLAKLNIYIVQGNDIAVARDARLRHLGDVRPASTLVYVSALADPKFQIEIEAVACR